VCTILNRDKKIQNKRRIPPSDERRPNFGLRGEAATAIGSGNMTRIPIIQNRASMTSRLFAGSNLSLNVPSSLEGKGEWASGLAFL